MAELKKRHEFWLALLIVVLFVGLAWRSDEFLTFGNLYDLANNYPHVDYSRLWFVCGVDFRWN